MTFFRAEDGAVIERRRGVCRLHQPLDPGPLPGAFASGTPCAPPPPDAVPLARFAARRAELAEGISWLEGRMEADGRRHRIALLLLEGEDALRLAAMLADDLPLLPARASLAEEALALVEQRPPRARASGAPILQGAETAESALRRATAHLLEALMAEVPCCDLAQGPRGVHQSRVALRRMRSFLKLFRPEGAAWSEWDGSLRDLAEILGRARDWDVFLSGIAVGTAQALGDDRRLRGLLRAAEAERRAAYGVLSVFLAGPEFRRLLVEGMRLAASPAEAETPLSPLATRLLRKRWRRLKRAGVRMEELDAKGLHEMRLDAKRLRYAAEPFAALFHGRGAKRFNRRLAALQDALGLANDAAVARHLAAALAGRGAGGFAIGTVTGYAAGRAEGSRLASLAAWRELRRTPRFWRGTNVADS
ncbi:CYTH and CHAD domain-containing protein [Sabulicella rubraurantiaca]|uniref:CYTH and CHAD domain-containing protein n=1 Tax=Sabulicella rubraurantiaca TaxID=2811429 RepID=UPI001A96C91B|nr:CHAD domain-containing protein [Sabulicella rubraurantiaca]